MTTTNDVLVAYERFGGNKTAAAEFLGIPRTTFRRMYDAALSQGEFHQPVGPLSYNLRLNEGEPVITRVTVIPDAHDHPNLAQDRFEWFGKHVAEQRTSDPNHRVVWIGDAFDFESLCSHIKPGTLAKYRAPTFNDDLDSAYEALEKFYSRAGCGGEDDLFCEGNHEVRIKTYENANPELDGTFTRQFNRMISERPINYQPYGKYNNISGVSFTHVPFNIMGAPQGGKQTAVNIGRDSVNDTVFGHTHRLNIHTTPKNGDNNRVRVVECGSGLPWGYIAPYAGHSMTGWWWGLIDLTIYNNRIEGVNCIPMYDLEHKYR